MASLGNWIGHLRQALELLYYVSGIVIAIAAVRGLRQLTITRQIAKESAKREAYKLAADECRHFAEYIVPLSGTLNQQIEANNIQAFAQPRFAVAKGEIEKHNFALPLLVKELPIINHALVSYLNAIKAFAIFFASGVAAEEIGYRETGTAFCSSVKRYMPAIWAMRLANVRYESTVRLYEIWDARQKAEKISKRMKELEAASKRLPSEKIKPIGT